MSLLAVKIAFIVFAFLSFLFALIALATPAWRYASVSGTYTYTLGTSNVSVSMNYGFSVGLFSATCTGLLSGLSCSGDTFTVRRKLTDKTDSCERNAIIVVKKPHRCHNYQHA